MGASEEPSVLGPLPPLLRWAGSKRQIVETLAAQWPTNAQRYVEPFAGSACLFFRLRPAQALLSDINSELITTYAVLNNDPDSVHREMILLGPPNSRRYYEIRSWVPEGMQPAARAARFLFLNRLCFNGLYRTDRFDRFNVPFGGSKVGSLPSLAQLRTYADALAVAELVTDDFESTVARVRTGDFVYLDPPYAVKSQWRRGLHYTGDAFAVSDVDRLRRALLAVADAKATFILSYADSPEGRILSAGFHVEQITVRRSIAGSALRRVRAPELLISNRPLAGRRDVATA